jgi:4-diphosphocytidyl-2-C-methyl-D-erythritol kinase
MIAFPNAKINIGLNITKKRSDGFHTIESVFFPINLCDAVEIIESDSNEKVIFTSSGIDIPGDVSTNLCCKAYLLINKDYKLPNIKIHLHKNIPIGAGLGGGSADAAFIIKLINEKFNLNIPLEKQLFYAASLGSDCSFFINNTPALACGVGEILNPIDLNLKGHFIALVYPKVHISTATAYAGVIPKTPKTSLKSNILLPTKSWKNNIHNDFEDSIFPKHPELKKLKEEMYTLGASYAAMSGSGSSVYGIFENKTDLAKHFSQHFVFEADL